MLSPATHYQLIPRENTAHWRRRVIRRCRKDKLFRAGIMRMCKEDCIFWINTFAIQTNPKKRLKGPFVCWGFQIEAVRAILGAVDAQEDIRWQKSREMGASWLALLVLVWLCLFHWNVKGYALSRDEDAVDKVDESDSLFWKVNFIHEHLPRWMTGEIRKRKLSFFYVRTGSSLTGEANVPASGVGGRATIMLVDEFGQFKNGHETYSMTSDTADFRLFVGTHKDGPGSMFYSLCFDEKYAEMREVLTHWSQHPSKRKGLYRYDDSTNTVEILDKQFVYAPDFKFVMQPKPESGPFPCIRSPWYDKQCRRREQRDIAMNLDIDPRGAADKFFDSFKISVLKTKWTRDPSWVGKLIFDKEKGTPIRLVQDPVGPLSLWVLPTSEAKLPVMRAAAGMDVSAGTGASSSTLCIYNADTGEKVLEYAYALIYPAEFAAFVAAACRMIVDKDRVHPLLAWEIQGSQVIDKRMREIGYGPYYLQRDEAAAGRPVNLRGKAGYNASEPGIKALMERYRDGLFQEKCLNTSLKALDDCLNFVYTATGVEYRGSKKPKAVGEIGSGAKIHHGDIPRADALAWMMVEEIGLGRSIQKREDDWIDTTTFEGRRKLAEKREMEELVWA